MNTTAKTNTRREFLKRTGVAAAVTGLTALIGCGVGDEPLPPTPPPPICYPDQLPSLNIINETEPGKNDGSIQNLNYQYAVEVSPARDFSSGNFTVAPNAIRPNLLPGNYYARWAANGACPADSKILDVNIAQGKQPPPPPLDIDKVEPYTVGSNQEWAEWALKKLPNSAEKLRLYNYLLRAHTHLMCHDEKDYDDIYNSLKKDSEDLIANPQSDLPSEVLDRTKHELADENWMIYIEYPLKKPFNLTQDEILEVNTYLRDANPQFILPYYQPIGYYSGGGVAIRLRMPAYYAKAENRQQTYKKSWMELIALKQKYNHLSISTIDMMWLNIFMIM